jgi:hypothetical protein
MRPPRATHMPGPRFARHSPSRRGSLAFRNALYPSKARGVKRIESQTTRRFPFPPPSPPAAFAARSLRAPFALRLRPRPPVSSREPGSRSISRARRPSPSPLAAGIMPRAAAPFAFARPCPRALPLRAPFPAPSPSLRLPFAFPSPSLRLPGAFPSPSRRLTFAFPFVFPSPRPRQRLDLPTPRPSHASTFARRYQTTRRDCDIDRGHRTCCAVRQPSHA